MNCFFSHKYGRVETDGFQYCKKCGGATKPTIPHVCENGHTWHDETIYNYVRSTGFDAGTQVKQIYQKCSKCGERQVIWR